MEENVKTNLPKIKGTPEKDTGNSSPKGKRLIEEGIFGEEVNISKKNKRRKKNDNQEFNPYRQIVVACKTNQPKLALSTFERALQEDLALNLQTCNSVLFLCMGGENWDKHLRARYGQKVKVPYLEYGDRGTDLWKFEWVKEDEEQQLIEQNRKKQENSSIVGEEKVLEKYLKSDKELKNKIKNQQSGWMLVEPLEADVLTQAEKVIEYIKQKEYPIDEVTITSRARLAVLKGDIQKADQLMQYIIDKEMHVKLRIFHPALVGYMLEGNVEKVLELGKKMNDMGLDFSEAEFALVAEAVTINGTYKQVTELLYRMQKELAELQDYTIDIFKKFFGSKRAEEAFAEGNLLGGFDFKSWKISKEILWYPGNVEGKSNPIQNELKMIDLETSEWGDFLEGLEQLAIRRVGKDQWQKSRKVLDELDAHILIDGANVALFNSSSGQDFRWENIRLAVEAAEKNFPGERLAVFLNIRRVTAPYTSKNPENKAFVEKLQNNSQLFIAPKGANDDWFWLYAVVKAAEQGYLISNDELRDHIFQLIRPKYFLKWKDRHQIRYSVVRFKGQTIIKLEHPLNYTTCVQELPDGAWMLPTAKKRVWTCVKPIEDQND